MGIVSIILIAIGLSIDSFAVSLTNGFAIKGIRIKNALWISSIFAMVQTIMPLIGWFIGKGIEKYIVQYDHWLAFVLLFGIGVKMIYDSMQTDHEDNEFKPGFIVFLTQGIATSIDALVIGVSIALLNTDIMLPVIIIGICTLIFSISGHMIGKYFGSRINVNFILIGGIILIGIGIKILIEHLFLQ